MRTKKQSPTSLAMATLGRIGGMAGRGAAKRRTTTFNTKLSRAALAIRWHGDKGLNNDPKREAK